MSKPFAVAVLVGCAGGTSHPSESFDAVDSGASQSATPTELHACTSLGVSDLGAPASGPLYAPGDPIVMVHGPQGGWHVAVDAVVSGAREVEASGALVQISTGEQLGGDDNTFALRLWSWDDAGCEGKLQGFILYIDDQQGVGQETICALVGESVRLTVKVVDPESGATADDSVELTLAVDPMDDC